MAIFKCIAFMGFIFCTHAFASEERCLYLLLEGGASFSQKAKFYPPLPWDPTPQGYSNKLRNSEVLGAGIGYQFCPLLATELKYNYRNSFKYKKFQSADTPFGDKIRFFNLKNTTAMADFLFYARGFTDCLSYVSEHFRMDPYVNVGMGLSYNRIENFHSVQVATGTVFSMMSPNTKTSFAYQLGLGLEVSTCDLLSVAFGYRFLDAGKFRSNSYIIDNPPSLTSGIVAPEWKARFRTNEIFVKLIFKI